MDIERINIEKMRSTISIPVWKKYVLTISEAAEYFNIGRKRLYKIVKEDEDADFVIKVGSNYRISRKKFEEYLENHLFL